MPKNRRQWVFSLLLAAVFVCLGAATMTHAQVITYIYSDANAQIRYDNVIVPTGGDTQICLKWGGVQNGSGSVLTYPYNNILDAFGVDFSISTTTITGSGYFAFGPSGGCASHPAVVPITFTNGVVTQINGVSVAQQIDWSAISQPLVFSASSTAIATSSSLWSSLNVASSTIQCNSGNLFSDGLCAAAAYLFVPNPQIYQNYTVLASTTLPSKFPFSWFYSLQGVYSNLAASSSANMATVEINLAATGIGSTTPMGVILPDVTVLSSTTITKYIPNGFLNLLLLLESSAIWVLFATAIIRDRHSWTRV